VQDALVFHATGACARVVSGYIYRSGYIPPCGAARKGCGAEGGGRKGGGKDEVKDTLTDTHTQTDGQTRKQTEAHTA